MCGSSDQIQKREQKNPDQIDDVPVQTAEINRREVLRTEVTTHATQEEPCDHNHANDDVGPVQARHGVVNAKIDVSICGSLGINSWIGMVMCMPFMLIVIAVGMVIVVIVMTVVVVVRFAAVLVESIFIQQGQTAK